MRDNEWNKKKKKKTLYIINPKTLTTETETNTKRWEKNKEIKYIYYNPIYEQIETLYSCQNES